MESGPLKLVTSNSTDESSRTTRYSTLLPIATLVTTVVLTILIWYQFDRSLVARAQAVYSDKTEDISDRIVRRMHDHEQVLRGAAGLFSVKETVTRMDWRHYVSALQLDENHPGILGIGFSKWLSGAEKNAHIKQVRSEGFPEYNIRPEGERSVYTSIFFLEPFNWRNQRAFGYDMYTEAVRKAAMDKARDENVATIAAKIFLIQETDKDKQSGMLMYVPVYRQGLLLDTVENRRKAFIGFAYSPIRMNDFVSGTIAKLPQDIVFDINIIGGKATDTLMFSSIVAQKLTLPEKYTSAITSSTTAQAYGCSWQFTFKTLPGFNKELNRDKSYIVFCGGITFSILLTLMVSLIIRNKNQTIKHADEKLNEVKNQLSTIVESSGDVIAMMDTEYRYTSFNTAFHDEFKKIFGKDLKHGDSMLQALEQLPEDLANAKAYWNRALEGEDFIITQQFGDRTLTRNWYELHFSPVRNSDGKVIGAVHIVRNVTERKLSEETLQRLVREQSIVLENSGVGISFVQNRQQKWANITFANIFGYVPEEMLGKSTSAYFLSQDEYDRFTEEAYPVLASGGTFSKSLIMPRSDNRPFHARFTGKAVDPENLLEGAIWILSDETVQKELEVKLQKSHDLLTTLSHQIPGAIFQFQLFPDGRSCFPYASDSLFEMYEVTPEEVREDATNCFANIHQDDIAGVSESIMESARTLELWECDYRVQLSQKGVRWRHTVSLPQKLDDGSILWHGFTNDSTEQKYLELELKKARDVAESANRTKSEFLANMSHEIRTPMNVVIGMTQLLELTNLTEEQNGYVTTLMTAGKNLLSLINDILDLSKIEAGKIVIEPTEFNLNQCINDVILMQKYIIYEKGLLLNIDIAGNIPTYLLGDQLRIKQIILNLLGNASKFTNRGRITISVTLFEQHGDNVLIQIAVRDTGIGISPDALDRIFKAFVQEEGSTTRKYGGTGLGLSISQRLAELLGGSISVESTQGVGSCFTVTLPLGIVHKVEPAIITNINSFINSDGPRLRILYAEDDQTNIFFGKTLLNKLGHDVTIAENGRECLAVLEQNKFDIVLMDIQMPIMNGAEAITEIRNKEKGTAFHQPVIALTAFAMRGDNKHYLEDGFDGFVSKPLSIKELVQEMNRLTKTVEVSEANHDN